MATVVSGIRMKPECDHLWTKHPNLSMDAEMCLRCRYSRSISGVLSSACSHISNPRHVCSCPSPTFHKTRYGATAGKYGVRVVNYGDAKSHEYPTSPADAFLTPIYPTTKAKEANMDTPVPTEQVLEGHALEIERKLVDAKSHRREMVLALNAIEKQMAAMEDELLVVESTIAGLAE